MSLLDAVFPRRCCACDVVIQLTGVFCEACAVSIEETPGVCCRRCSEPGVECCQRCLMEPPPFQQAYAPFEHTGAMAEAIQHFKYSDRSEVAQPLGRLLADHTPIEFTSKVWVPIPLHTERFRERGYCQATLLAAQARRRLPGPLEESWLTRIRPTERQVGQSEADRERNVGDAFVASPQVRGHDIVVIDDVYTTGATARAVARALLAQGAAGVWVLTLARTRREDVAVDR